MIPECPASSLLQDEAFKAKIVDPEIGRQVKPHLVQVLEKLSVRSSAAEALVSIPMCAVGFLTVSYARPILCALGIIVPD